MAAVGSKRHRGKNHINNMLTAAILSEFIECTKWRLVMD